MPTSIKKSYTYSPSQEQIENRRILNSVLTDLTALRASIVGVNAKLDADAGVTDVNYASLWNPAALDLTA